MIRIDDGLRPQDLEGALRRLWSLSAEKVLALEKAWDPAAGSPVFTVAGRYTARGWTEWTQGFQFGSVLLQFDATGDRSFLDLGRSRTLERMAPHLTHVGVHDHGFNNVSTYGALWRLACEGRFEAEGKERALYELALRVSGAVQARRWTRTADGGGFIHSFNGAHSLFADTMRTLRALALGHLFGHVLFEEGDRRVSLLERLVAHARATASFAVYYGEGRDAYDVRGRVAHESLFNVADGQYRCPGTQQGYSPFSTWTRGLAWVLLGFAEELEFLEVLPDEALAPLGGRVEIAAFMIRAAQAPADFYLATTPPDGVPYWDTGAPGLAALDVERAADPYNDKEPVDSSAAAIAAQGLLRLARYLTGKGRLAEARRYGQAGLTVARTLLQAPYLSEAPEHQGLLLHSVYHRPNGWDYVPPGRKVPCGESSQWGDYHLRELGVYLGRLAAGAPDYRFFGP
ncbi:MAG TPA: glycosyl hydrolase [Vicinamibacteria bacterium]|nr:glycosyl hydrolase [Vicinamibacteria bacterium]